MIKKSILFFLLITSLFSSALVAEDEKVSLQFHWKYQFEFAGFIMAKEKGFYKEVGLDVELKEYDFGMDVTQLVLDRESTYGIYSSYTLIEFLKGKEIRLLSSYFKRSALVLITQPHIKTLKDLVGKKIMASTKEDFELNFQPFFEHYNLSVDELNLIPHSHNVQDFADGKVDAITAFISDQPYKLDQLGKKYNILDPSDVSTFNLQLELFTSKYEVKHHLGRTQAFKDASIKGWEYAFAHKEEAVDIIYNRYSKLNTKEALMNEAKEIERLILPQMYEIGAIDKNFMVKQINLYRDTYNLTSAKTLKDFTVKNEVKIRKLLYSKDELNYLNQNPIIKICATTSSQPLEFLDTKDKDMHGAIIDIFNIIEKDLGVTFEYVPIKYGDMSALKTDKCSIISHVTEDKIRDGNIILTQPYLHQNLLILTKKGEPLVANINSVIKKNIALIEDSPISVKFNQLQHKSVNYASTKSELYNSILHDKSYYTLLDLATYSYDKSKFNLENIQVTGQSILPFNSKMALMSHNFTLRNIVDKSISKIDKAIITVIYDKWTSSTIKAKEDYTALYNIIIITMIIIAILIYFQRKLTLTNRAILEQKESFERLFYKSSDGMFLLSNSNIYDTNDAFIDMFKADSNSSILSKHISQLSPLFQEDGSSSYEKIDDMIEIALDEGVARFEWLMKRESEEVFWSDILLTKMIIAGNLIIYGVIRDISEEKALKFALEESNAKLNSLNVTLESKVDSEVEKNRQKDKQLLEQSRLAQMGEMIGMIAHQWRQPLSAISATASNISFKSMMGGIDDEYLQAEIELINDYSQHLSSTIDDFRNFYKDDSKLQEVCTLKEITESTLNIIKLSTKAKGITVTTQYDDENHIYIHTNETKQVILNLIKNAEDVLMEKRVELPSINIKTYKEDDKTILEISDNGGGVPKNILSKIFDPYFSTKLEKDGTGLGLYMSKIIIEEHGGGTIGVSNSAKGAIFKISMNIYGESI